jgi:Kef-type K+ transport system membrane component KefB
MIAGIDPILPAMVLGITMANLAPRQSEHVFELVRKFSPPVYISFFVLAGAHIELGRLASSTAAITAVYISFRVGGKVLGAWFGARYSGAPAVVRKYLGFACCHRPGWPSGLQLSPAGCLVRISARPLFGGYDRDVYYRIAGADTG